MKWWFYVLLFGPFAVATVYAQYVAHANSTAFVILALGLWTAWLTSGYLRGD